MILTCINLLRKKLNVLFPVCLFEIKQHKCWCLCCNIMCICLFCQHLVIFFFLLLSSLQETLCIIIMLYNMYKRFLYLIIYSWTLVFHIYLHIRKVHCTKCKQLYTKNKKKTVYTLYIYIYIKRKNTQKNIIYVKEK